MSTKWPTEDDPGVATIRPTDYGTFGIYWSNFEAMERRGAYSGPYRTREEAHEGARIWAEGWDCPIVIVDEPDPEPSEAESRVLDGNR